MAERAQVTSVETIGAFRSELIVYLTRARAVLEEASDDVTRTRLWVQNDQRHIWEQESRKRYRKLEEARAELFSAQLSKFHESTALCLMAVQRAEHAHREAEAKMGVLKKWDREIENRSDPLVKQVSQLHGFLSVDMKRAVAELDRTIKALEAYAELSAPGASVTAAPVTPPTTAPDQAAGKPESPA
jgi:hypothetical protein